MTSSVMRVLSLFLLATTTATGSGTESPTASISTVAGNGVVAYRASDNGGLATSIQVAPDYVAVDEANGIVFFTQQSYHVVRALNLTSNRVYDVIGDGIAGNSDAPAGTSARVNEPAGIVFDPRDGTLYFSCYRGYTIRAMYSNGSVATIAGTPGVLGYADGPATAGKLYGAWALELDTDPAQAEPGLLVADASNNRLRRVSLPTNGSAPVLSTIAGSGAWAWAGNAPAMAAALGNPTGLAVSPSGTVYMSLGTQLVVRFDRAPTPYVTVIAGTGANACGGYGGPALASAVSNSVRGLAVMPNGFLAFSDLICCTVRMLPLTLRDAAGEPNRTSFRYAGSGTCNRASDGGLAVNAQIMNPVGIRLDSTGGMWIATPSHGRLRYIGAGAPPAGPIRTSSPSPTLSATASGSASTTGAPSVTASGSAPTTGSGTPTATGTTSPSATGSPSAAGTPLPSASATRSRVGSGSSSGTRRAVPTSSASRPASRTRSAAATVSRSAAATVSRSAPVTQTRSRTVSATCSRAAALGSFAATQSPTKTPSITYTPRPTRWVNHCGHPWTYPCTDPTPTKSVNLYLPPRSPKPKSLRN